MFSICSLEVGEITITISTKGKARKADILLCTTELVLSSRSGSDNLEECRKKKGEKSGKSEWKRIQGAKDTVFHRIHY